MLSWADLVVIATTALVVTALVTGCAVAALHANRRGGIGSQLAIVVASAILSVVGSTVAVSVEMYLSTHDLEVLG
ncbi:MAG: two-component sensor histidine kinase, partial [Mycobacteriaceae bacterium]|nr:two-component sensor histidine kinase [Mycobacteriaceae bacterium]